MQAVLRKRNNVLIFGERGVGKTFLLRLIEDELIKDETVFAAYTSVSALNALGGEDPVAAFSRQLLLQFCAHVWDEIFGRSYLDLRETLDEGKQDITLRSSEEEIIQRIYSHLMTRQRQGQYQMLNTVGFSAGVKGEKTEQISHQKLQADVLPFEFVEFTHEITQKVLTRHGKSRVVILCDEANLLSSFFQEEILNRYFDLFCPQQFQFVFVAGLLRGSARVMPDCFETLIELTGFPSVSDLSTFIHRANTSPITIPEHAISALFEEFHGHPRHSLGVCERAYETAVASQQAELSSESIRHACRSYRRLLARYEREIRGIANNRMESDDE